MTNFYIVGPRNFWSLDDDARDFILGICDLDRAERLAWFLARTTPYPHSIVAAGGLNPSELVIGPSMVHPDWRGRGLQRQLIIARQRFAEQEGYESLGAIVDLGNDVSLKNLLACKFRTVGLCVTHREIELSWNNPKFKDR